MMTGGRHSVIETSRDDTNRERRAWQVAKSKDGIDGEAHPFSLLIQALGDDEYGDPVTSCTITRESPGNAPKPLTKAQSTAMFSYHDAASKVGTLDDDGDFVGLHVDAWRPEFYRTCVADSVTTKRQTFHRVRRELVELHQLSVNDDFYRGCSIVEPLLEDGIRASLLKKRAEYEAE